MTKESGGSAQVSGSDDSAVRELDTAIAIAQARKERLLRTAFRDAEKAPARFDQLSRQYGSEGAVAIAEGRGALPRSMWLGSLRGGLLNGKARSEAKKALEELPEAVRAYDELVNMRRDVINARRIMLDNAERERLRENGRTSTGSRILDLIRGRKR